MNTDRPVDPEARWIRLQEIGIVLLLAIPGSLLVLTVVTGGIIVGDKAPLAMSLLILGTLGLGTGGVMCLKYGYDRRREIVDKDV